MSYKLVNGDEGLELHAPPEKKFTPIRVDFSAYQRLFRTSAADILKRAFGKMKPEHGILELTLGLAHDGFRLAGYGYRLFSVEENPIIFQLVDDAYDRFTAENPSALKNWKIMNLHAQDIPSDFFSKNKIHTIYLDPMFPENKAASGKDSQVLQDLCDTNPDSIQSLVDWAFVQPVQRIIIKRPRLAPALKQPFSHQLQGKTVRWDVYAMPIITAKRM